MIRSLGLLAIGGLLLVLVGIGVIAYVDPLIAVGVGAVLIGIGMVVMHYVRQLLGKLGLGAMM